MVNWFKRRPRFRTNKVAESNLFTVVKRTTTGSATSFGTGNSSNTFKINDNELMYASITSAGAFITKVMPKLMFRQTWRFLGPDGTPLGKQMLNRLTNVMLRYSLPQFIERVARVAMIYGRALVFVERDVPEQFAQYNGTAVRVVSVKGSEIHQDENGWPEKYVFSRRRGRINVKYDIPAEDAVLVVYEADDNEQLVGTSALRDVYMVLKWSAGITSKWSETMQSRGTGFLDFTLPTGTPEDVLDAIKSTYENTDDYSTMFHTEQIQVQHMPTNPAAFDLAGTHDVFTQMISSATGIPQARIIGVQTGAVTGSETDQDNFAQILSAGQEEFEPDIKRIIKLLDPGIDPARYDIKWEFDIQMSDVARLNRIQLAADVISEIEELITVRQAFDLLQISRDLPEDELNMIYADWLRQNNVEPEQQYQIGAPTEPVDRVNQNQQTEENNGRGRIYNP